MGHIDGHGLIHSKAEEGVRGGLLVIVLGLDIRGALHTGGNPGKRKASVIINEPPNLELW